MKLLQISVAIALLVSAPGIVVGQVVVDAPGVSVKVDKGNSATAISIGPGSKAGNSSATVDADVSIEGVAVINDDVFIDGEKVKRGKTRHTSKKTGKSYLIEWGKDGNVSVRQN
jgi:hypothetical protein